MNIRIVFGLVYGIRFSHGRRFKCVGKHIFTGIPALFQFDGSQIGYGAAAALPHDPELEPAAVPSCRRCHLLSETVYVKGFHCFLICIMFARIDPFSVYGKILDPGVFLGGFIKSITVYNDGRKDVPANLFYPIGVTEVVTCRIKTFALNI